MEETNLESAWNLSIEHPLKIVSFPFSCNREMTRFPWLFLYTEGPRIYMGSYNGRHITIEPSATIHRHRELE